MKIAQVSPLAEAVPPKLYGGTERIVAYLCDELATLGHDVTLFASGDSKTKAKLEPVWPHSLRLASATDWIAPHFLMLEQVSRRADEFDLVHLHVDYLSYGLMRRLDVPYVTTLHGRLDRPELQPLYDLFAEAPVISISDSQRKPLPQANFVATVLHGLPERHLRPFFGAGGYLAFLGRISPEKAPDAAIRIAAAAGMKLKIAAKVDKDDEAYFRRCIEPLLNQPHVEFLGEIGEHEKAEFLGNAAALLFPIAWREPFGLVMIEAMACGTPVIAFPGGSVVEVIEHGVTGFIVETEEQATAAAGRLRSLDRVQVRRVFEERFTARRMAEDYLKVYRRLVAMHQPLKQAV